MLRNIMKAGLVILTLGMLSGCTTNANVNGMVMSHDASLTHPKNTHLLHNVSVTNVQGGEETNPLWVSKINNANFKEALTESLEASNLYNDAGRYQLRAVLMRIEQPFMGINMEVTSTIQYILTDTKTNQQTFNQQITASYTASFSDSPIGLVRLRLANEGSAKENIKKFIESLYLQG